MQHIGKLGVAHSELIRIWSQLTIIVSISFSSRQFHLLRMINYHPVALLRLPYSYIDSPLVTTPKITLDESIAMI
jgi:hypothetical protein